MAHVYGRLKGDTTRPLLQGSDPEEKIRTLIKERDPLYREAADVIIQVDAKSFDQILNEIEAQVTDTRAGKGTGKRR